MKKIGVLFAMVIMIMLFAFSASAETYSGDCGADGDNVKWVLYDDGELVISGSGNMGSYSSNTIPWYSVRSSITKVTIENDVPYICNNAFYGCDNLTTVNISDSVKFIGSNVFYNCTSLTSVTIGNGVTQIGDNAFYKCTSLRTIIIPENVTSIGKFAFENCSSLDSITIGKGVNRIYCSFIGCSGLKSVYITDLAAWCNINFVNNDYSNPLSYAKNLYLNGKLINEFVIPDGVTKISDRAFYNCKNLTNITIPDSVTSIGSYAFYGCSDLKSVKIPNSTTIIDAAAFYNCTTLSSITIGEGVKNISGSTFYNCTSLSTVEIGRSVKTVGYNAFYNCRNLSDVYYAGTKNEWKNISFNSSGNDKLTGAKIYYNFDPTKKIVVFSSDPSFTIKTGESMWLGFGLCNEFGYIEEDWRKMSVVVSDPTILSLSEYTITDYGYSLEVIAKKQGATTLTISDTENGLSRIIRVIVTDTYSKTYSYAIDNMVKFYPQNSWEDDILTNIYNLNGIYVNNYNCQKNENGYTVAFDVYNAKYFNGAVDVYDADGNWKESKKIEKYSDISSLVDVGKQGYYIVADFITGKMFTYEQASYSKHTKVEIEVPEGGYFTISNNMSESIGTFLYNSFEILFKGASEVIELATSDSNEVYLANFTKLFEDEIKKSPVLREVLMEKFLDTAESEIEKISENVLEGDVDNAFSGLSEFLENLLDSLDISWKHYFQISTGCGQKIFTAFSGPAGTALKSVFAITEGTSDMLFAIQMAKSLDEPYATVYSSLDTGYVNPYGIVVTENNNVDEEAVLQVFKVTDNGDFDDEISELYNICFVKNDELVQPTGMVKVYIPIPENMIASTCTIYRQETDGIWTALVTTVEGNYLVFETDHFSLYAITGDEKELGISSQPNILQYEKGDVLNADGLSLILGDGIVSSGFVCEPTVLSNCGEEIITVKYKGLSTSFTVWVNHTYITEIKAPATHTKEGVLTYTCSECGDSYTDKIDKTTEHTYNEKFIAPSCTETGYTVYTCECGDTYISDYISETGHSDNNNDGTCDGCGIKLSTTDNENCSCNCHKSGLMGIIWKILRFFYKLFKINPVCACGVAHY